MNNNRGYSIIVIFCVVLCGAMLLNMLSYRNTHYDTSKERQIKLDEVQIMPQEQKDSVLIDQKYIGENLGTNLPENFPIRQFNTEISENGEIAFSTQISRDVLEREIGSALGMKERMLLKMLPGQLSLSLYSTLSVDEESKMLNMNAKKLVLNGMQLGTEILPQTFVDQIAGALNNVLIDSGHFYDTLTIVNGGIQLNIS